MSKIIEKTFDASKKIIRSIFRGSPNLLTATDLNRQITALKAQIDALEDRHEIISNLSIVAVLHNGTTITPGSDPLEIMVELGDEYLSFRATNTEMMFKGCRLTPKFEPYSGTTPNTGEVLYICLMVDKKVITYDDDFSHEISGAKFEDGTSLSAADNEVYDNERIIITKNVPTNCAFLLGKFVIPKLNNRNEVVIPITKYWKSSPWEFEFQRLTKSPFVKFGTYDKAICTLMGAISNKGNALYQGKCLEGTAGGDECGLWNAVVVGRTLHCHAFINQEFARILLNGRIVFDGFEKWHFVNKENPISFHIYAEFSKGSERVTLSNNHFEGGLFAPHFVYTPIVEGDGDTYKETYKKESCSLANNIWGFSYAGSVNINEWELDSFRLLIEFTAILTNEYGGEYLEYIGK